MEDLHRGVWRVTEDCHLVTKSEHGQQMLRGQIVRPAMVPKGEGETEGSTYVQSSDEKHHGWIEDTSLELVTRMDNAKQANNPPNSGAKPPNFCMYRAIKAMSKVVNRVGGQRQVFDKFSFDIHDFLLDRSPRLTRGC